MNRATLSVITVLAAGLSLSSVNAFAECTTPGACQTNEKDPFATSPFQLPAGVGDDWKGYRTDWSRITGFELSGLHWQQFVIVYLNKGRDIYKQNYGEYVRFYVEEDDEEDTDFQLYPTGTVFIKENYLAQDGRVGQPLTLTTMVKREPGYDPEHNDWEYIQSSVSGKVLLQGPYSDPTVKAVCAECHNNIAERDYIFSTFYSE